MDIYVTSKNTGPSWHIDPIHMVYLGPSYQSAVAAVGTFKKYDRKDLPIPPEAFSVLPHNVRREMIHYYMAGGRWYTVEKVTIPFEENSWH